MIIPAGKRRLQVNQGFTKHESIMDSDIFAKIAIGKIPGHLPEENPKPPVDDTGIGDAMSQGGLKPKINEEEEDPNLGVAGQNPKSIAPSGNPRGQGNAPADQFLGPAPVDPNQGNVDPFERERQKIRQFVGYQNFAVDLKPDKSGGLEVILTPPQGTPVDVGGLLEALQKQLGGQWGGESTPASSTGGPIKFKYMPEGMEKQNTQQMVEKGGPPLGAPLGKGKVTQSV